MSFLSWYFGIPHSEGEHAVLCPFPHTILSGEEYQENNPSAHVNTDKNLFHCKACGKGYSEKQFMQETLGCTAKQAYTLSSAFYNYEDINEWRKLKETYITDVNEAYGYLGISPEVMEQLNTTVGPTGELMFPVFMYDKLVDIRKYSPNGDPKVKSRADATAGLVIPFDTWVEDNRTTLLCAGEKDMAISRTFGFNAITLTGGENVKPVQRNYFKDRDIVILYDNDPAGKIGAVRLAIQLQPIAKTVRVCMDFHTVCTERGEDIHDFFMKYGKTREDLIQHMSNTPIFNIQDYPDIASEYKLITLYEAGLPKYRNKVISSNIQVTATSEQTFHAPISAIGEKFKYGDSDKYNTVPPGTMFHWEFDEDHAKDILHLMDNNFKETEINTNLKTLLKIPHKEQCVKHRALASATIYKCSVTDMFETLTDDVKQTEYVAYSVNKKLESGKKYNVRYRLVPHPYKGQNLVMIILDATQATDTVDSFRITNDTKALLNEIKSVPGSVEGKVNTIVEKVKGLLGYNGNNLLIQTLDLAYHTPLEFNFGRFEKVRAYLDTILVGESRVGKSSTAETLQRAYKLGTMTSLAGNSATVAGLIGGSNKVQGSFQTRAGLIPQNHRGLMIFEEFGKCNTNVVRELTDIRSSNEVRITRVSGTLTLPALVRMVSLTNVKSSKGEIKSIASYPNGISIITDLVGSAEDIARYDIMLVLSDRGNTHVDPFWQPATPFSEDAYTTRVRWVWSRKPEQIIFTEEVGRYLIEKANTLNDMYDSHIKIFGTEAWKKLARVAIAVAGYVVSTDDSFEHIIVTKEHVDFAVKYFIAIYDNDVFKLGSYVEHERKYSTIDDDGVALLQSCYDRTPGLLLQLEQVAKSNKAMLQAASGLTNEEYNTSMTKLVGGMFVRFNGSDILPTERFRLGMAKLDRSNVIRIRGDINVGLQSNQ